MKFIAIVTLFSFLSISHAEAPSNPPHWHYGAGFKKAWTQWQNFKRATHNSILKSEEPVAPDVQETIDAGEKTLAWLRKINEKRKDKLRLSQKDEAGGAGGVPVEDPASYGPAKISKALQDLKANLPLPMKEVILGDTPISSNLPVDPKVFVKWARQIMGRYETAVRWQTLAVPYRRHFKWVQRKDVRGYYFLKDMKNLDRTLSTFHTLPVPEQKKLQGYLKLLCYNSMPTELSSCAWEVREAIANNTLVFYKNKYWPHAVRNWKKFFDVWSARKDVRWNKAKKEMVIPFRDPNNDRVKDFVKNNSEDEFRWKTWKMIINMRRNGPLTDPFIRFQAGTTAHVAQGNIIVMDENISMDEPSEQWVIRHEFGHILHLPDCYIEFYEEDKDVMTFYQIDTTDLMCSRAGKMNERIYKELKRVYFNNGR